MPPEGLGNSEGQPGHQRRRDQIIAVEGQTGHVDMPSPAKLRGYTVGMLSHAAKFVIRKKDVGAMSTALPTSRAETCFASRIRPRMITAAYQAQVRR